jgi:uncharacterized membrane protein YdfJ with MMPL/SSD domain
MICRSYADGLDVWYLNRRTRAAELAARVRTAVHAVPRAAALVGGNTAVTLDIANAADHDRNLIIPLILLLVFVVLAGTFAALSTLPVTFLAEIGFAVAFGVLLDTIIVRSVLVTALNLDLGRWVWWPSALFRHSAPDPDPEELDEQTEEVTPSAG